MIPELKSKSVTERVGILAGMSEVAKLGTQAYPPEVLVTKEGEPQKPKVQAARLARACSSYVRIQRAKAKRGRTDLDDWQDQCVARIIELAGNEAAQKFLKGVTV